MKHILYDHFDNKSTRKNIETIKKQCMVHLRAFFSIFIACVQLKKDDTFIITRYVKFARIKAFSAYKELIGTCFLIVPKFELLKKPNSTKRKYRISE